MALVNFDVEEFRSRFRETKTWCLRRTSVTDPGHSLRSEALRPPNGLMTSIERRYLLLGPPWQQQGWDEYLRWSHEMYPRILIERQSIVENVSARRRERLLAEPRGPIAKVLAVDISQDNAGRFLAYNPEDNLSDGAAMNATFGFFDEDNIPPWDTWLMYVVESQVKGASYLISWVPESLLTLVDAGIRVNPEKCIQWADDVSADFIEMIRQAGLLP